MCSILGIFNIEKGIKKLRKQALKQSKKMRHRGPDWSGIYVGKKAILAHERLAIIDIDKGAQPLHTPDQKHHLAVNGEIYNHHELKEILQNQNVKYDYQTKSDCEVILALYNHFCYQFDYTDKWKECVNMLRGMFAFALYDEEQDEYLIARDHIGIIPLYYGYDADNNFYVASEMKSLTQYCKVIREFPPGHFLWSGDGEIKQYYQKTWQQYEHVLKNESNTQELKQALEDSVSSHLMSDVPYGVLLSGGLDSSVIAAVAKKKSTEHVENDNHYNSWWPSLHSFAIGLEGSPDLQAAQTVADYIGTIHHGFTYTIQEGIDALSDVIYHIETFDVTTIRASVPMYLLARKIKAMGIKMVLSGEGADEAFGGYLYFHNAPNAQAFHEETVRKLGRLNMFDCLRANKSMSAWGVEVRVPFLDKRFLDVAMNLNPSFKLITQDRMEKTVIREAFDGYIPSEILWRQKEQFSDGVGYGWIDALKDLAEKKISDKMLENAQYRFPINPPDSKEAYMYRGIFEKHFKNDSAIMCVPGGPSIACSSPEAYEWVKGLKDPSGRAMKEVHVEAYE